VAGYVALMVDSLTHGDSPRPAAGRSSTSRVTPTPRYRSQQSFVAPERIAVLGNSMGGYSALYAVDRSLMAHIFDTLESGSAPRSLITQLRNSRDKDDGTDPDPDRRGRRLDSGGAVPRDGGTRPAGRRAGANRYHR
jgi:hypothetical protein